MFVAEHPNIKQKGSQLTGVNQLCLETNFQVMEDRSIIEVSQISHVLTFLKFGRIHLANLSWWKDFFLKRNIFNFIKKDILTLIVLENAVIQILNIETIQANLKGENNS